MDFTALPSETATNKYNYFTTPAVIPLVIEAGLVGKINRNGVADAKSVHDFPVYFARILSEAGDLYFQYYFKVFVAHHSGIPNLLEIV